MNLLAIGVLALVASDPVVEERTEYYDVAGSSALELYNAMLAHGPKGAQGVSRPGSPASARRAGTSARTPNSRRKTASARSSP
jgi:predicted secreted Zn-dependent protease